MRLDSAFSGRIAGLFAQQIMGRNFVSNFTQIKINKDVNKDFLLLNFETINIDLLQYFGILAREIQRNLSRTEGD